MPELLPDPLELLPDPLELLPDPLELLPDPPPEEPPLLVCVLPEALFCPLITVTVVPEPCRLHPAMLNPDLPDSRQELFHP